MISKDKNKTLVNLLIDLNQTTTQTHLLKAAKFTRETKSSILNKVKNIEAYLDEQAKLYGQNSDATKEIKDRYKESIHEIRRLYNTSRKELVIKQQNLETMEIKRLSDLKAIEDKKSKYTKSSEYFKYIQEKEGLEEEINKAKKNNDLQTLTINENKLKQLYRNSNISIFDKEIKSINSKIEDCRNQIKKNKNAISNKESEFNNSIADIKNNERGDLATLKKQTAFGKFIGSIFKKIGGSKKFANDIITPLDTQIDRMKNAIETQENNTPLKISESIRSSYSEIMTQYKDLKNNVADNLQKKNRN